VNGSANKAKGGVNGLMRGSSESCRTMLDEMQLRSVQPPDVVTSQRRRDVDGDSLEVHRPAGVDNPGYAQDSLEPVHRRQSDGDRVTPTFANGDAAATRRSPTRLQYVPPSTRSPLRGFVVDGGRRSATPSSSMLPRNSPIQRPTSAPGGKRSAPLRSTPVGGLENVYEEEPGGTAAPTMMMRGRVLTPTVGLTVEEVDRITDSRRCTPAAAAAHSSTSSTGRASSPDLVNRTDFTRDDLELVARPRSTTSDDDDDDDDDETQDETFTCSEYDSGGRRRAAAPQPMLDFANPYRLRMAPSLALPPPPPPPPQTGARRSVTPRDRVTGAVGPSSSDGSTADEMFSVDDRRYATPPDGTVDLTRAAAALGWTPNFDVVAEVFLDLAALSDAGRSTAVAAGGPSPLASPVRSTPRPVSSHRGSRSDTPSSRTHGSPMNNVEVDRVRPLQRLASPVERLAATGGHRSVTPSSQSRHTPLDAVQRRAPSSSTSSPLYMSPPPPPVYDGRGQTRMSSPRDQRLASPALDAAARQRDTARALTPRTTPRPVLEEYV